MLALSCSLSFVVCHRKEVDDTKIVSSALKDVFQQEVRCAGTTPFDAVEKHDWFKSG